jgi:hypothetical protein
MGLLPRALLRLVVLLWVTASAAQAAERVTVFGDVGKGSGRLEFNWPRAVLYDARVILGRLVVQFSEPGDFDFSAYRNSMPQYLGHPTVVADGAVIAFPLRIPVTLRHRQEGPLITIELHDEHALPELSTAAGDDPEAAETTEATEIAETAETQESSPAEPPVVDRAVDGVDDGADEAAAGSLDAPPIETFAGPASGPPLGLRIGEHPGFSRLVFDWPSDVAYRIEQRGDRLTIQFDAEAELDVSRFERNPQWHLRRRRRGARRGESRAHRLGPGGGDDAAVRAAGTARRGAGTGRRAIDTRCGHPNSRKRARSRQRRWRR